MRLGTRCAIGVGLSITYKVLGSQPPEDLQHRPTNKNAPQDCEAFGAENETRTVSCNMLIISDLKETEKTSGET
jgi:hypothetical protein